MLRKHAEGSPCLGYRLRDVYNKLTQFEHRRFDDGDANSLIEIFDRRLQYEDDF